jgi:hypothetical protein
MKVELRDQDGILLEIVKLPGIPKVGEFVVRPCRSRYEVDEVNYVIPFVEEDAYVVLVVTEWSIH